MSVFANFLYEYYVKRVLEITKPLKLKFYSINRKTGIVIRCIFASKTKFLSIIDFRQEFTSKLCQRLFNPSTSI